MRRMTDMMQKDWRNGLELKTGRKKRKVVALPLNSSAHELLHKYLISRGLKKILVHRMNNNNSNNNNNNISGTCDT